MFLEWWHSKQAIDVYDAALWGTPRTLLPKIWKKNYNYIYITFMPKMTGPDLSIEYIIAQKRAFCKFQPNLDVVTPIT
jgi:hypothetical protein